ncbi:hypothetical protein [Mycolicibacterium vinylchloridicum]|uniref:hypothetical protein n=1 Tax=Mycolicibacterium vinylchloridicum TaxID=2736928 RepID=UPI00103FA865|nr:hypothetical protein [Mycolicibacterium vinylchloridicum]
MFNAGNEWEHALASDAVAAYAATILDLYNSLPDQLRSGERPEDVLQAVASAAKTDRHVETGSAAEAMAERAFIRLLMRTSGGGDSLSQLTSRQAAQQFVAQRGTPGRLVSEYLAELLGQYARHATAREAGRITEAVPGAKVSDTRRLTREVAQAAADVGSQVEVTNATGFAIRGAWATLVAEAFAKGRQLPDVHQ